MSDPRKDSILRERILTSRPIRFTMLGVIPLRNIGKVMDPTAVRPVWECAQQAAGLVGNNECFCWVEAFEEEVQKWKAAEMFGEPTTILVDLILETAKSAQYQNLLFELTDPNAEE